MRCDSTRNLEDATQHLCGPRGPLSPVSTGDGHPTGDGDSRLISTMSPVSPLSPVAHARMASEQFPKRLSREKCGCA